MEPYKEHQRVAVLGASNKPDRYSCMAVMLLKDAGHEVIPIHPRLQEIQGISVTQNLDEIEGQVDTLTLYVGPRRSMQMIDSIISLNPGRVILNPGTDSEVLENRLAGAGIPIIKGCTLVMVQSGQF